MSALPRFASAPPSATVALRIALCAILWLASQALVAAAPVRLEVRSDADGVLIAIDGETYAVPFDGMIRGVEIVAADPFRRELPVDGSDSLNTFTYDPGYFAGWIAPSPYYQALAWIRDEAGYSTWRDLTVTDTSTGRVIERIATPPETGRLLFPPQFQFTAELRRFESPRELILLGDGDNGLRLTIHRNERFVRVIELVEGIPSRVVANWFFPGDPVPAAATLGFLILRVVAAGLALSVVITLAAAIAPGWSRPVGGAAGPILALCAALLAVAGSVWTATAVFDRAPQILDAVAYSFQGKVLAGGALAVPAPPVVEPFAVPFTIVYGGQWFSQYPPGAPLTLAAGFLIGVPWLVHPLLAGATTWLTYLTVRRQFGAAAGLIAAALLAASPFLYLMAAAFLSHLPAACFGMVFIYAATRYLERPATRWAVAGAAGIGAAFLTREMAAVAYAAPVMAYLALALTRRGGRPWRLPGLPAAGICLAALAAGYLGYNWALTGSPFQLPRLLFSSGDSFGFGPGFGFYGRHTLAAGLVNAEQLLTSLDISLFGWPVYVTLALILSPFLLGRTTPWDRVNGAIFGLLVIAYVAYFYHGIALGPRYYADVLPVIVVLAARGLQTLAAEAAAIWGRAGRSRACPRARDATLALGALLLIPAATFYAPRQVQIYRGASESARSADLILDEVVRRDLAGRVPVLPPRAPAVVLSDNRWFYMHYLAALICPRLDCPVLFALSESAEDEAALRSVYPDRAFYQVREAGGRLELQAAEKPGP